MKGAEPGLAGNLASSFLSSKLTPILIAASLFLGAFAVVRLPREEEPQIHVPMFDIFVPFPGASATEVEERVVRVGERKLWEIPDVEYIYTTAEPGMALFVVRFKVGTDPEEAMTRVYTKTFANVDLLPPGSMAPLIKPRSIDDVPIAALTLTGAEPLALRRAAAAVREEVTSIPDVAETTIIGGRRRQFLVHFDPSALRRRQLTVERLAGILQSSNIRLPAGHMVRGSSATLVETDSLVHARGKKMAVGAALVEQLASVLDEPGVLDADKHWLRLIERMEKSRSLMPTPPKTRPLSSHWWVAVAEEPAQSPMPSRPPAAR